MPAFGLLDQSSFIKIVGPAFVGFGILSAHSAFTSGGASNLQSSINRTSSQSPVTTHNTLKSGFTLAKSENQGNANWNFEFKNSFNSEKGLEGASTKKFDDVTMQFGNDILKRGDLLVSPAQNGIYYLAKKDGNQFRLQDGTKVSTFNSRGANWTNFKHIKLDWTKSSGGIHLDKIAVDSCTFKQERASTSADWKIRMTCHQYSQASFRGYQNLQVSTVLSKEDFKSFFSQ